MTSGALTDFKLAGNPTTNAARLKAMAHGGPLVIAHDHWLSAMMPDALADAAEGGKKVYMADLDQMVLDAMLIDSDVAKKGVHFGILPARYKQLLVDVGNSGNMDWSPVYGDIDSVLPTVKSRFIPVIKALTEDKRTLTAADLLYDGNDDNAETGVWYDWLTPAVLMASGGGMPACTQFRAITRDGLCKEDEGGRKSDDFNDLLGQILGSVGRDVSNISQRASSLGEARRLMASPETRSKG